MGLIDQTRRSRMAGGMQAGSMRAGSIRADTPADVMAPVIGRMPSAMMPVGGGMPLAVPMPLPMQMQQAQMQQGSPYPPTKKDLYRGTSLM